MVDIDKRVKAFVDVFCAPVPIAGQVVTRTKRERSTTPVYDVTPEKTRSWNKPAPRTLNVWQLNRVAQQNS